MNGRINKKIKTWYRKVLRRHGRAPVFLGVLSLGAVFCMGLESMTSSSMGAIDYRPLLQLIGQAESDNNYNAYYGDPDNQSIVFTSMSIQEVMLWQGSYIAQGSPSSAVGRYQIIDSTLKGLVDELQLDSAVKFDESTQDLLAVRLIERRGYDSFTRGLISAEQFASNLSKEWAALPRVVGSMPNDSYYAGDGLNQSRVTKDQILNVIAMLPNGN